MDNLTHALVGAALAESGPRDRTALATPTLIIAANVPDVDVVSYLIADEFAALAWRRGITHGVPALVLWPFVVALGMLAWDLWVRRRREPDADPARFRPLFVLAALGAATHPALDWLNTYGMRWWLPFDGAWSYGDAAFIIDPWLWLGLGGAVFLARSRSRRSLIAWALVAALTTALVIGTGMVPAATKAVWLAGVLALAVLRLRGPLHERPVRRRSIARIAVTTAGVYVAVMVAAGAFAERSARTAAIRLGIEPLDVMAGPMPGRIVSRDVIVRTSSAYHVGSWNARRSPRLELTGEAIPLRRGPVSVIDAAIADPRVVHFLTWSRYPYLHAARAGDSWAVRVGDARYEGSGLGGLVVSVTPAMLRSAGAATPAAPAPTMPGR